MIEITQCPECGTRFKVTDAQLDAHDGLVRCGHCHEVFNAREHLHDDEPSPQLSLPIEPEALESTANEIDLTPIPGVPELEEEPATLAQQVQFVEELTDEVSVPPPHKHGWMIRLSILLLMLALLAQAIYLFRVELGAYLPGVKPLLAEYCEWLACTVPLPRKADLISIESSELTTEPAQPSIVNLNVLLHNRAPYAQAYPSLELTLTDLQDQVIARKLFHPQNYIRPDLDEKQGILPRHDFEVKLRLETTDLKPSGYRVFLLYPE